MVLSSRRLKVFRVLNSRYNALGFWVALRSGESANAAFIKTSEATTINVLIDP
jgi:hypothetical protein